MNRRHVILAVPVAASLAAAGIAIHRPARAAEAAVPMAGHGIVTGLTDAERLAIGQRLQRENFQLAGDVRRKGSLIVATAVQQGVPWRLVFDGQTGEIIGRRPLGEPASLSR